MTKKEIKAIRNHLKTLKKTRDKKERMFHFLKDDTSRKLFLSAQNDYQKVLLETYKLTSARSIYIVEQMIAA